jgi:hypothetical protein
LRRPVLLKFRAMSGAAGAAAAAAARRRRLLEEEEEEMTAYGADDLQRDWEFKIVRANRAVFGNPAHLNRLLEEEARAGWIMVEKFDNSRIRFKRLRQARGNDSSLPSGVDPYRVHYGLPPATFAMLLLVALLALTAGIIILIVSLVPRT